MKSFLELPSDERDRYVATMLGLYPNDPASWDKDLIERIVDRSVNAADLSLHDAVRSLLSSDGCKCRCHHD